MWYHWLFLFFFIFSVIRWMDYRAERRKRKRDYERRQIERELNK